MGEANAMDIAILMGTTAIATYGWTSANDAMAYGGSAGAILWILKVLVS